MLRKKKRVDPIPEEFPSYEEAAEFWDTHDPEDYPDAFRPVKATVELRRRRYEIEIDEDVFVMLCQQARNTTISQLVNKILRQSLLAESIKKSIKNGTRVLLGLFDLNRNREMFPHPPAGVLK
jgi:hypothetical protein